jgi:branched-chain amino acid aminotransferase
VSTWRRIDDNMIPPRAKVTGLYVNSAMAKTEAWENGFDEAIILNHDGHVSEGSGENVFLVSDGKLLTPPSSDNILVGITRDTVIKLAKNELGVDTVERSVDRTELYLADECFLTGTAAHLTPVCEIDHRDIGDGGVGEITSKLQQLFFDVIRGKNPKYMDWCTPAYSSKAIA